MFQVFVRIRPQLCSDNTDTRQRAEVVVSSDSREVLVREILDGSISETDASRDLSRTVTRHPALVNDHCFEMDRAFGSATCQSDMYDYTSSGLVRDFFHGTNVTIIGYGQTGTGKTYTIEGDIESSSEVSRPGSLPESYGIAPRALFDVFEYIGGLSKEDRPVVYVSYVQLYNDVLTDLLVDALESGKHTLTLTSSSKLGSVSVSGLSSMRVSSPTEALELLKLGRSRRVVARTASNDVSSRSHAIFSICLVRNGLGLVRNGRVSSCQGSAGLPGPLVSKLNLVDLAGSERVNVTGATGVRLEECKRINASLSALSAVIHALSKRPSVSTAEGSSSAGLYASGSSTINSGICSRQSTSLLGTPKNSTQSSLRQLVDPLRQSVDPWNRPHPPSVASPLAAGLTPSRGGLSRSLSNPLSLPLPVETGNRFQFPPRSPCSALGKEPFVSFRSNKLTVLLQDSLGGKSKTAIICTVSSASDSINETLSTLRFAAKSKGVRAGVLRQGRNDDEYRRERCENSASLKNQGEANHLLAGNTSGHMHRTHTNESNVGALTDMQDLCVRLKSELGAVEASLDISPQINSDLLRPVVARCTQLTRVMSNICDYMIEGRNSSTQWSNAPTQVSNAPTQMSNAPTQSVSNAPTQGRDGPTPKANASLLRANSPTTANASSISILEGDSTTTRSDYVSARTEKVPTAPHRALRSPSADSLNSVQSRRSLPAFPRDKFLTNEIPSLLSKDNIGSMTFDDILAAKERSLAASEQSFSSRKSTHTWRHLPVRVRGSCARFGS